MEKELKILAKRFNKIILDTLNQNYPYAPGYNGQAYSQGRNGQYRGEGPINASGGLRNGIEVKVEKENEQDVINVYFPDYWRNVDEGRRPGKYVPIKPLEAWAKIKLGLSGKEARSAAFGISKNIQKFGIRPTYFYSNAIDGIEKLLDDKLGDIADEVSVEFEDFIDNLFEKIKD